MNRLPDWLKTKHNKNSASRDIRALMDNTRIHTVCESARCPNRGECFANKTVTFMILGNTCTRNCTFCAVTTGQPDPVSAQEANDILDAVKKLGLEYIVITSVTRDDLSDGGADQFAQVIQRLKTYDQRLKIEILTPDFKGDKTACDTILKTGPDVFNHNIETVPRLYPTIRPQATYSRSLEVLTYSKQHFPHIKTKSGLMVGLGERPTEIIDVLGDLKTAQVDIVTIGQYIQPTRRHAPVIEYIHPDQFNDYRQQGEALGLKMVSEPFVRSSYKALEAFE